MPIIYLGLGSNMGDRFANLGESVSRLISKGITLLSESSVYETEPWGFQADIMFLNRVVSVETDIPPVALLEELKNIENEMGRIRNTGGYESRVIDIDILFYDDVVFAADNLVIPHPHLHERMFVLEPLSEIAPDFIHPVLDKTVTELKDELQNRL